jgi:hypothetical protein
MKRKAMFIAAVAALSATALTAPAARMLRSKCRQGLLRRSRPEGEGSSRRLLIAGRQQAGHSSVRPSSTFSTAAIRPFYSCPGIYGAPRGTERVPQHDSCAVGAYNLLVEWCDCVSFHQ